MCGRYTLIRLADFTDMFPWIRVPPTKPSLRPRFNIAPTQMVPAIANDGANQLDLFKWGLIPSWATDPTIGSRMINARSESVAEKPAFRAAFRRRRCLLPASGFYEWKKQADRHGKTPIYIRAKDHKPFAFAGLCEVWRSPHGERVQSCTILTTRPNDLLAQIHDRMPVILSPQHYRAWLDPAEASSDQLLEMLQPYPAELMEAYSVSRSVNSPKNDSPELIEPADAPHSDAAPARRTRKSPGGGPGLFDPPPADLA